jgi:hypothetical protein
VTSIGDGPGRLVAVASWFGVGSAGWRSVGSDKIGSGVAGKSVAEVGDDRGEHPHTNKAKEKTKTINLADGFFIICNSPIDQKSQSSCP